MISRQRIEAVGRYIDQYYKPYDHGKKTADMEVRSSFEHTADMEVCFPPGQTEDMEVRSSPGQTEDMKAYSSPEQTTDGKVLFSPRRTAKTVIPDDVVCNAAPPVQSKREGRKLDDLIGQLDETFSRKLIRMIREHGMREKDVYKKAFIDRRHFSKIKKNIDYAPNKKTVLAFAIAMELSLDEAMDLLRSAGYALSQSSKFDIIVAYFLENKIYNVFEINEVLYEYGQQVFG